MKKFPAYFSTSLGDTVNGYAATINIGLDLTDAEVGASDSVGGPGGGPPP